MLDSLLRASRVNIGYAQRLLADVPPEKMTLQPVPGMNHPAWILGHLTWAADSAAGMLGLESKLPAGWAAMFRSGVDLAGDAAYPDKTALLAAFETSHTRLADAVPSISPEVFDRPFPKEALRALLPTIGVAVVHILTTHAGVHLGQISAWRRAQGLPPLF